MYIIDLSLAIPGGWKIVKNLAGEDQESQAIPEGLLNSSIAVEPR